jgi:hypothetical protein
MTVYTVGEDGATVFDEMGQTVSWLRPGLRVIAGSTELAGSPADLAVEQAKRVRGYADKALHPVADDEDKAD